MKYLIAQRKFTAWTAFLFLLPMLTHQIAEGQDDYYVYIASSSDESQVGIPILKLDGVRGTLTQVGSDQTAASTGYLSIHPQGKYLYAIDGQHIYAFAIERASGNLAYLDKEKIVGRGPCHVSVNQRGDLAFVANYGGGEVLVYPLNHDGTFAGPPKVTQHSRASHANPQRQTAAHPHMVLPVNDRLLVPDLGADLTYVYDVDPMGNLKLTAMGESPAGGGPRHFCFLPNLEHGYVLNELTGSVTAFDYDQMSGHLNPLQTLSTLPMDNTETNKSADIHITPDARYLYASNRGPNTIAFFAIDQQNGLLTSKGTFSVEGDWPRAFGISPDGKYLLAANKLSDSVVVFRLDQMTGQAKKISEIGIPGPQCVKFLPTE